MRAFVSFDHPDTLAHFPDLANIAEPMVVEEMKLLAAVDNADLTLRVATSYLHDTWAPEIFPP